MTVFIVFECNHVHEQFDILGVFSSLEKAKAFIVELGDKGIDADIDERIVDNTEVTSLYRR